MNEKKNYIAPQAKIIYLSEQEIIASNLVSSVGGIELPDHDF